MKKHFAVVFALALCVGLLFVPLSGVAAEDTPSAAKAAGEVALTVAPIFGDKMVLQRDKEVAIWGTCTGADTVTVTFAGQKCSATVENDRWKVTLHPMPANAKGQVLSVCARSEEIEFGDVLVGDVWLCSGQSNMDMQVAGLSGTYLDKYLSVAENRSIRVFRVPRSESDEPQGMFTGTYYWSLPSQTSVRNYSAYAYAYAVTLEESLNIPIGIVDSSYGGTDIQAWMTPEAIHKVNSKETGSGMYNAMVHPFIGLAVKGILWYQGEANAPNPSSYAKYFREFVAMCRELFHDSELPIITTQLPKYEGEKNYLRRWKQMRIVQWEIAEELPYVYTVCGIDLGDANDIHPKDKFVFGERAANLVLNTLYSKNTPGESPYPIKIALSGNSLVITFKNIADGLMIDGNTVRELYVKGADGIAVSVTGTVIAPDTLQVDVSGITKPSTVNYCMADVPDGNLFDISGLPVAPFDLSCDFAGEDTHTLTVKGGKGSGEFTAGQAVTVKADTTNNFLCWELVLGNAVIANAKAAEATVTLGDDAVVLAVYGTNDTSTTGTKTPGSTSGEPVVTGGSTNGSTESTTETTLTTALNANSTGGTETTSTQADSTTVAPLDVGNNSRPAEKTGWVFILLGGVAAVVIAGGTFLLWKKRKQ